MSAPADLSPVGCSPRGFAFSGNVKRVESIRKVGSGIDQVDAAKITRRSKSNLALAFVSLGKERRRDITTFYAFCRVIDDIADDVDLGVDEKQRRLNAWRSWLRASTLDEPVLARDVRGLIDKNS